MHYLLTLYITLDDFAGYISKLPLELVPSKQKVSIYFRPMLCLYPIKTQKTGQWGEHKMNFPNMDMVDEKYSYNFHGSETF